MEVEVVEAETRERFLGARDRLIESVVAAGDLARDEEVGAVDGALRDRLADFPFVLVVDGRVKEAVAALDAGGDRFNALRAGHRIRAESDLGDRTSVVEFESGNRSHDSTLRPPRR